MSEAFLDAVAGGDVAALRGLLRAEPSLVRLDEADGLTPLHLAVEHGHAAIVDCLLDAGADPAARNAQGRTPLHDAIEHGYPAIAERLIERGAPVDVNVAAILGRLERLRALLDENPALANDRSTGLSPLGWAAYGNQVEAARELIERGARMDDGELLCAAAVGQVEVGALLLAHGADPNAIFGEACGNALHAAASMRYTCEGAPFVRLLLDHGADPTLPTAAGKTALQLAVEGRERQRRTAREEPEFERDYDAVIALLG